MKSRVERAIEIFKEYELDVLSLRYSDGWRFCTNAGEFAIQTKTIDPEWERRLRNIILAELYPDQVITKKKKKGVHWVAVHGRYPKMSAQVINFFNTGFGKKQNVIFLVKPNFDIGLGETKSLILSCYDKCAHCRSLVKHQVLNARKIVLHENGFIATVDHIIPKVKGGTGEFKNLQLLCMKCNLAKSDANPSAQDIAQGEKTRELVLARGRIE